MGAEAEKGFLNGCPINCGRYSALWAREHLYPLRVSGIDVEVAANTAIATVFPLNMNAPGFLIRKFGAQYRLLPIRNIFLEGPHDFITFFSSIII